MTAMLGAGQLGPAFDNAMHLFVEGAAPNAYALATVELEGML